MTKTLISTVLALCLLSGSAIFAESQSPAAVDSEVFRVAASGLNVWAGWNSSLMYSSNAGATWEHIDTLLDFPFYDVSSMYIDGDDFWAGLYFDSTVPAGYEISLNGGLFKNDIPTAQWELLPPNLPTFRGNVPYGLAVYNDTIWSGNWMGGLRLSSDGGNNWEQVLFGSPNDPIESLHHRIYAVIVDENDIWAGSENGLNHSTNRGEDWEFIRHDDQDGSSINANKVVGLNLRQTAKGTEIWAAAWRRIASGGDFGISISSNAGQTWRTVLPGLRTWSIYFFNDDIFVPTDSGLWFSDDNGDNFINISDAGLPYTIEQLSVCVTSDSTIWLGTKEGLFYADYTGQAWGQVDLVALDADDESPAQPVYLSLGQNYPNPFNPSTTIPVNLSRTDDIQLKVYNILGHNIRTVYSGRLGAGEHNLVWDGCSVDGRQAAGGVYFYELTSSRGVESRSMLLIK